MDEIPDIKASNGRRGCIHKAFGLFFSLFIGGAAVGLHLPGVVAHTTEGIQDNQQYRIYGAPSQLKGEAMSLSEAMAPANLNTPIRVEARVTDVCQNKGCWMILTDGERYARVTFKDYGFFVPKDLGGKTVIVEGLLSEKVLTEDRARHMAKDAGKSEADIEKIVGDQKEFTLVADTVIVPQGN